MATALINASTMRTHHTSETWPFNNSFVTAWPVPNTAGSMNISPATRRPVVNGRKSPIGRSQARA